MTTALILERAALFESVGAVQAVLVAVADLLAARSSWSGIWVDAGTTFAQVTEESAQRIVVDAIYIGAASPRAPTHVLDLFAAPSSEAKMGRVCLNLRVASGEGAFPGMRLIAELDHDVFDVSPERLLDLLERAVAVSAAGFASVGARAAAGRAQWATFVRRRQVAPLPPTARLVPTRSGTIVVAHDGAPLEQSDRAQTAIAAVQALLDAPAARSDDTEPASLPAPSTSATPVEPTREPADIEQWLEGTRELPREVGFAAALPFVEHASGANAAGAAFGSGDADLDGTRELLGAVHRPPPLPFGGEPAGPSPGGPSLARPTFSTGTEDVNVARIRELVLPFRGADGSTAAPQLTLEDYARLRARLSAIGEGDRATWAAFGITSAEAKDDLQRRFVALFRTNPDAQARFVSLVRTFVAELAPVKHGPGSAASPAWGATALLGEEPPRASSPPEQTSADAPTSASDTPGRPPKRDS